MSDVTALGEGLVLGWVAEMFVPPGELGSLVACLLGLVPGTELGPGTCLLVCISRVSCACVRWYCSHYGMCWCQRLGCGILEYFMLAFGVRLFMLEGLCPWVSHRELLTRVRGLLC